ncbi:MAG TPA: TlpA disulfide reductase family protein [Candidatus Methylomirabilis sp.]|nr:TlpA disulfide reductase family protein [Candidatus Methylomirabilis sp.]
MTRETRGSVSTTLLGTSRRGTLARLGAVIVLLTAGLWMLPGQRADDPGASHSAVHDAFELAGVVKFKAGQRAPTLRLRTFASDGYTSLADFQEKLVVLNFWATWCEPCTLEMPTLEALWQQYRARGLVVVGVSVDRGAPKTVLDPYVKRLGLTFPVLVDPDLKTADGWHVAALPATFIIRPDGDVAGMATGAREWNATAMKALLETLLPVTRGSASVSLERLTREPSGACRRG